MDSALLNFIENLHNIRSYGEDFHELSDFKTFLASIEEYIDDYENISFIDLLRRKILDIISNSSLNDLLGMSKESIVERMRENDLIGPATNLILDEIKSALSEISTEDFLNHLEERREHKKQKSSGSYLSFNFNFDDLPDTPPLFSIIMELQQSPYNYNSLNKLLEIDSSEILEHCQWPMLLQLLRKSMVVSRENFCYMGQNETDYEMTKLKSLEVHAYWILTLSVSQATDVAFNALSYLLIYAGVIPDNLTQPLPPPPPPPPPPATTTISVESSDVPTVGAVPLVDFGAVRSVLTSPLPLAHCRLLEVVLLSTSTLLAQCKADKSTDKLIAMIFLLLAKGKWPDGSGLGSVERSCDTVTRDQPSNELPQGLDASSPPSVPLLDLLACVTTRRTSALQSESPEGCEAEAETGGGPGRSSQCFVSAWLRQGGLFPASLHSHALRSGLLLALCGRLQSTSDTILAWTPSYTDNLSGQNVDSDMPNQLSFIYHRWCFDARLWISIISSVCDDVDTLMSSIPPQSMDNMKGKAAADSSDCATSLRGDLSSAFLWNGELEVHSNFNGYSMSEEKDVIMIPKLVPDLDSNKLFWNLTVDLQDDEVAAESGATSTISSVAVNMTARDAKSDSSSTICGSNSLLSSSDSAGINGVQRFLLRLVKSVATLLQLTTEKRSSPEGGDGPDDNNSNVFYFIDSQYDLIDIIKGLLSICCTSNKLTAIWPEALGIISDVILQSAKHINPYPFTTPSSATSTIHTKEINAYYLITLLDQIQLQDNDSGLDKSKYSFVMSVWHQLLSQSIRLIQENSQQQHHLPPAAAATNALTSTTTITSLIVSCVSSINRTLRYSSSSFSLDVTDSMFASPIVSLLHTLLGSVEQSPAKGSPSTQAALLSLLLEVSRYPLQRTILLKIDRNDDNHAIISGESQSLPLPLSFPRPSLLDRIGKFLLGALCDAAVAVGSSSTSESGEGADIGSIHPITTALLEFLSDGFTTLEAGSSMEWLFSSPDSHRYRELLRQQIASPSVWEALTLSKATSSSSSSSLLLWLLGLAEGLVFMGRLDAALKLLGDSLQPFHRQKDGAGSSEITLVCWSMYDTGAGVGDDSDELAVPTPDSYYGRSTNDNCSSDSLSAAQSDVIRNPFSLLLLRILRPTFYSLTSCLQIKIEFDRLFSRPAVSCMDQEQEMEQEMEEGDDSMSTNLLQEGWDNITWYRAIASRSIDTLGTLAEKRIPLLFPVDDQELDVNISKLYAEPASHCTNTTQSYLCEYSTSTASDEIFLLTYLPTLPAVSILTYLQQRLSSKVVLDKEVLTIQSASGLASDLSSFGSEYSSELLLTLEMITKYAIQCNYLDALDGESYKSTVLRLLASINKSLTEPQDNHPTISNGNTNLQLVVLVSITALLAPSSADGPLADPLERPAAVLQSWYSTPSALSHSLPGDVLGLLGKYRGGEAVHIWQLSGCSLREVIRLILQQWFVNWLKLEDIVIITCCCLEQGIQQAACACAALMWILAQKMRYSNSFVVGAGYENLERTLFDCNVSLSSLKLTLEELNKLSELKSLV